MSDQNDYLLTTAEAARRLGTSGVHLRRLARAGRVPSPVKVGLRKLGWRLSDVYAVIDGRHTRQK
jgi:excisionase family DNA binding protein